MKTSLCPYPNGSLSQKGIIKKNFMAHSFIFKIYSNIFILKKLVAHFCRLPLGVYPGDYFVVVYSSILHSFS